MPGHAKGAPKTPGSGRQKGQANIRSRQIANKLAKESKLPLELMVERMLAPMPIREDGEDAASYFPRFNKTV